MKRQFTIISVTALAMIGLISTVFATPRVTVDAGATQVSGIGYWAAEGACNDPQGADASYALTFTGDFSGCHYVTVEVSQCRQGGAYYESGTETFVGMYNGGSGTFDTNYVFTATYRDCPNFIGEVAGRCQHPIVAGSGTGVFLGVTGRFNMKDDVVAGNFPYRGHLSFGDSLNSGSGGSLVKSLDLNRVQILGTGGC